MDARKYLQQLQALKEDIKRTEDKIKELDAKLASPGALRYDKVRVQSSPVNQMEEGVIGKAQVLERLEKLKDRYISQYVTIMQQIDGMENQTFRRALKYVYVDGMTIRKAAKKLKYSEDWTYHILARAREAFGKKYLLA